jgi:hypothetical protein
MSAERDENVLQYSPPGPVAARFHNEFAFVRGLMGPVGSGKSSSCCMEILFHTMRQEPFRGVRRARWAVIRNTYPELKSTTIKTWQAWFPESIAPMNWGTPITSRIRIADIGDGTGIDLEVIFIALDQVTDVGKLKSLELTGAWLNEASEIPKEIFDKARERVNRYPSKKDGGVGCVDPCVILDTNPMDDDHWYYVLAEEETPKGWRFFKQPGGMMPVLDAEQKPLLDANGRMTFVPNPEAENIFNLNGAPYDYYRQMLGGNTDAYILTFVCGQYGRITKGRVVYPTYNDRVHCLEEDREAIPGLPIYCGWDFGLTPAFVVVQPTPLGELLVLDELVAEDMDVREFADAVVAPFLATKYQQFRRISVGDPAGTSRSQIARSRTPFTEVNEAGILTEPADTNMLEPRIASVSYFLSRMAGGKRPAFQLNKRCKVLRRGFNGGYMLERLNVSGSSEPIFKDRPAKNKFSHPHDALQYACLAIRGNTDQPRAREVKRTGRSRS